MAPPTPRSATELRTAELRGTGTQAAGMHATGMHAAGLHATGLHAAGLHATGLRATAVFARLGLRRCASPGVMTVFVLLCAGVLLAPRTGANSILASDSLVAETLASSAAALDAARERTRAARLVLMLLAPTVLIGYSALHDALRRDEADGLGAAPVRRVARELGLLLGALGCFALMSSAVFALVELRARDASTPLESGPRMHHDAALLIGNDVSARFDLPALAADARSGAQLAVRMTALPGAQRSALVQLELRRATGERTTRTSRTSGTRSIELAVPSGDSSLELLVTRTPGTAGLALAADSLELLRPSAGWLAMSRRLWLHGIIVAAAGLALFSALRPFVAGPFATALVLALALAVIGSAAPLPQFVPGAQVASALRTASTGVVPRPIEPFALAALLLLVAGSIGMACLGPARDTEHAA